jgi:iron complex outermembrane receptor protein
LVPFLISGLRLEEQKNLKCTMAFSQSWYFTIAEVSTPVPLADGWTRITWRGCGIRTIADIHAVSAALFGQLDWQVTDRLHILPGLRYNYDKRESNYVKRMVVYKPTIHNYWQ